MDIAKGYAKIFGAVLLLVGILGFIPGVSSGYSDSGLLLGIFAINPLHNVIHIVTGLAALGAGFYGDGAYARMYALVFGLLYALVTIVGFGGILFTAPGNFLGIVPINTADNFFHLAIAVTLLGAYFLSRSQPAVRTA